MRIAIVHWSRRRVGGAESYLEQVVSALAERGHLTACLFETDLPAANPTMVLPAGTPAWCVQDLGVDEVLRELQSWRADVIYAHGVHDRSLEERIISTAPAVFYAHGYYGTCISGNKAFAFPDRKPCAKRFGAGCLLHYFPRRCGGLNPLTMWMGYSVQARRLRLLANYQKLIVASEHMAGEYQRHGLAVEVVPFWADETEESSETLALPLATDLHLLFMGRMEKLKGGQLLLDALASVAETLQKNVVCHFAGAGQAQAEWHRQAARVSDRCAQVKVEFHGWLSGEDRNAIMRKAHLLVVPSVWPEPFGLVGLEAARFGIPAAAFDVGGIRQWLHDGINGVLAHGTPPRSADLAQAMVTALSDPSRYRALRENAARIAREQFGKEKHIAKLERILRDAAENREGVTCAY